MNPLPAALDDWVSALCAELGVSSELNVDVALILDLAGDAAHSVARPAAPLTTFLVGYAAARNGGSITDIQNAAKTASQLALQYSTTDTNP